MGHKFCGAFFMWWLSSAAYRNHLNYKTNFGPRVVPELVEGRSRRGRNHNNRNQFVILNSFQNLSRNQPVSAYSISFNIEFQ